MMLDRAHRSTSRFWRPAISALASLAVVGAVVAGPGHADPAADAVAKLNELSRQAEQTTEAMHSAQLDLDKKLEIQQAAETKHANDVAAVNSAKAELADFQHKVDDLAAAQYMGGRPSGFQAMLTASSPQGLIDQLSIQRVMAHEMSAQMSRYLEVGKEAEAAEQASAASASEAKTAAEQAAAVRADLQNKQSQLQVQIAVVKSQYETLSPPQREALAAMPPAPPAPPAPAGPGVQAAWRPAPRALAAPECRRPLRRPRPP
ncbi:endopeptidase, partial [Mycolicibacterium sp. 018/SC-01/001]|uniref:endopeptidase n=1 Tax=Mycolicibacterium sp. 018/SC-01/001 TaxID=2592069 RepID=UPI00351A8995